MNILDLIARIWWIGPLIVAGAYLAMFLLLERQRNRRDR